MGVSISMNGKDITPGWRSMLHQMLLDNFGAGSPLFLVSTDIPKLVEMRDKQHRGSNHPHDHPPFDWSHEIADAVDKIIALIKKRGSAQIESFF